MSSNRKFAGANPSSPPAACRRVHEEDPEAQTAPDEQLVPCMATVNVASIVKSFEQSVDWKKIL